MKNKLVEEVDQKKLREEVKISFLLKAEDLPSEVWYHHVIFDAGVIADEKVDNYAR